ncbi:MAG: hypothetical protein ABIG28_02055, partial [archaeon]
IIENMNFGKISFNEVINVTDDSNFGDAVTDIDSNVDISSNRIELDSDNLPNFNVNATLVLYGLDFVIPRILKDGSVCASDICVQNNYSGGNLSFNVTEFSVYSAEETPADEVVTPGGSGVSGGGGIPKEVPYNFTVDREIISVELKQGKGTREIIRVKNTGTESITIDKISFPLIEEFVKLSETSFFLVPGQSKEIIVDFFVGEDVFPEPHTGKIVIEGGGVTRTVYVAIDIKSENALFDIKVEMLPEYAQINPGEKVEVEIYLENVGMSGTAVDVDLFVTIMDFEDEVVVEFRKEVLAVETNLSIIREFQIPSGIPLGKYLFAGEIKYGNVSASSFDMFDVVEGLPKLSFLSKMMLFVILFVLLVGVSIFFVLRKRRDESIERNGRREIRKLL